MMAHFQISRVSRLIDWRYVTTWEFLSLENFAINRILIYRI